MNQNLGFHLVQALFGGSVADQKMRGELSLSVLVQLLLLLRPLLLLCMARAAQQIVFPEHGRPVSPGGGF